MKRYALYDWHLHTAINRYVCFAGSTCPHSCTQFWWHVIRRRNLSGCFCLFMMAMSLLALWNDGNVGGIVNMRVPRWREACASFSIAISHQWCISARSIAAAAVNCSWCKLIPCSDVTVSWQLQLAAAAASWWPKGPRWDHTSRCPSAAGPQVVGDHKSCCFVCDSQPK